MNEDAAREAESPEKLEPDLPELEFPALYTSADEAAVEHQKIYFRLIKVEYALLLIASFLALELSDNWLYYAVFAFVFVVSAAVLLYRTSTKPEQAWYKCRAMAESVKTLTWKYVMRAEPFSGDNLQVARRLFGDHLQELLAANKHIGEQIAGFESSRAQISSSMDVIRSAPLKTRRRLYLQARIKDQRDWYDRKADWNRRRARNWSYFSIGIYAVALVLVLIRIKVPAFPIGLVSLLVVGASVTLGWIQISKFTELSSAYTLTAHEIGLVESKIEDAGTEEELSDFVSEAELAFSREHTQWIARQTS